MFGFLKGKQKSERHMNYPDLPLNMRMNGLVRFKASSKTYFLLNEEKMATQLPADDCMIKAVSSFSLFGLNIYRAYLDSQDPKTVIQVHCDGKEVLDVIAFNPKFEFIVENDLEALEQWRNMIGFKDMNTPDEFTYFRDWSADPGKYGNMVNPVRWVEHYFESEMTEIGIDNEMMLYKRILDGGNDEDIEYLLIGYRRGLRRYRVEGWVGTVVGAEGIEFI